MKWSGNGVTKGTRSDGLGWAHKDYEANRGRGSHNSMKYNPEMNNVDLYSTLRQHHRGIFRVTL